MGFQIENGVLKRYIRDADETEVFIPEGVTSIGDKAFADVNRLNTVYIPNSVTKIGNAAFLLCTDLQTMYLPDSVKEIGYNAFQRCHSLEKLRLPKGLESIPQGMCLGCQNLEKMIIPKGVRRIYSSAFNGCASLESVSIPETVEFIANSVFDGTLWFRNHTEEFFITGKQILLKYTGTSENLRIPEEVHCINWDVFTDEHHARHLYIPANMTNADIAEFRFHELESIEVSLENRRYGSADGILYSSQKDLLWKYPPEHFGRVFRIPETVNRIVQFAFTPAPKYLKELIIPETIKKIDLYAVPEKGVRLTFLHGGRKLSFVPFEGWKFRFHDENFLPFLCNPSDELFRKLKDEQLTLLLALWYHDVSEEAHHFLKKNCKKALRLACLTGNDTEALQSLLQSGCVTAENIDELIEEAIQLTQETGHPDYQLTLTEYKDKVLGYTDLSERFRL